MDDRPINYPVVDRRGHYRVLEHHPEVSGSSPLSDRLHTTPRAAQDERELAETAARYETGLRRELTYSIEYLTEVYRLRCCTCGEAPPLTRTVLLDWDHVQHVIRQYHHTWVATSELTIFCPLHVRDIDYA